MIRRATLLGAIALSLAAVAAPSAVSGTKAPTARSAMHALESSILVQLNLIRERHHLAPLRLNPRLTAAARSHSEDMAVHGYFTHESRDGTLFWERVKRFYRPTGRLWSVGENLLWSSPDVTARRAVALWMASPGHRRNILTARWREIGIFAVHRTAAPGTYGGRPVTVVTTDFGVRH